MTSFQQELSGARGDFWKKQAEEALEKVKADLDNGKITIDSAGVARNCIGRVLMNDLLEQLCMVTDKVNVDATREAREAEVRENLDEYRAICKAPSVVELAEMRATFGAGATVINVLTGNKIKL